MQPFETFTRSHPSLARLQRGASALLPPPHSLGSSSIPPAPKREQFDVAAATQQWDREHPFAPDAAKPDFLRGASALLPGTMEFSGSSQIGGYDANGNPLGTTGGLIPEQDSDRNARLQRGASALLTPAARAGFDAGNRRLDATAGGQLTASRMETDATAIRENRGKLTGMGTLRTASNGAPLGASAFLSGTMEYSGSSPVAGYAAGNPIGTTGGLIPEQDSDRYARQPLGASALLTGAEGNLPSSLPPPDDGVVARQDAGFADGNRPVTTPARESDLRTLQLAYGDGARSSGSDRDAVLDVATSIADLRTEDAARRRHEILKRDGALYDPNSRPEVRTRQLAYGDTLLSRAAAGQDLRVGGLAYMGDLNLGPTPATGSQQFTKKAASLAEQILRERTAPQVVEVGKGPRGESIKAFINPKTGKSEVLKSPPSTDVEEVVIGPRKYFRYDGKLFNEQGDLVSSARSSKRQSQSGEDREAYEWALNNPEDPRAAAIIARLGE